MILRALWLRPTLRRPARALATVAGVAIGVAAFVATLLASRAALASMREGIDELAGRAVLEIAQPGGVDERVLAELRPLASRALFLPLVEESALAPALGDAVRVLGLDLLADLEGRGLAPRAQASGLALEKLLREPACLLPEGLARELGLAPGAKLELLVRARRVELEVAALFEPARFSSIWSRAVLIDLALAQELYGLSSRVSRIEVLPRGAVPRAELERAIAARLPEGVRVEPPSERRRQGEELLAALEFNLLALSGISILIGAVLVATALATSIVQRRAEVALLRSLGASRAQVASVVLAEAASIGLVGGALGVLAGVLGARAALSSVRATVASVAPEALPGAIELEPRWVLLGALLALLVSLAASIAPLREALSIPPRRASAEPGSRPPPSRVGRGRAPRARATGDCRAPHLPTAAAVLLCLAAGAFFARLPALGGRPVFGLVSTLCLLASLLAGAPLLIDLVAARRSDSAQLARGAVLALARAALAARRSRAAWAAAAVGVAVALAVSMALMVTSFRGSVAEWSTAALRADLGLRPLPGASGVAAGRIDPEVVEIARARFSDEVDAFHTTRASFAGAAIDVAGGELAVVARHGGVPFLDGRDSRAVFAEALAKGGALANEPFARRFGLARGDRIELESASGRIERELVGVFRSYSSPGGLVVLDRADFLLHFPDEGPRSISIHLEPGEDPERARAALLADLGGRFALEVLPQRALRAEVLAIFDRTFAVTIALELVAAAVAALSLLSVLFALVREEASVLAALRAIGATRLQVAAVVLGQALLLASGGALGGIGAGFLVGLVLVKVVNLQSFGWSMDLALPWAELGLLLAALLVSTALAALAPAWKAARLAPREVLRDEG